MCNRQCNLYERSFVTFQHYVVTTHGPTLSAQQRIVLVKKRKVSVLCLAADDVVDGLSSDAHNVCYDTTFASVSASDVNDTQYEKNTRGPQCGKAGVCRDALCTRQRCASQSLVLCAALSPPE